MDPTTRWPGLGEAFVVGIKMGCLISPVNLALSKPISLRRDALFLTSHLVGVEMIHLVSHIFELS
jgi:hypothetical protein